LIAVVSREALVTNESHLKQAERIMQLAELSRKMETEREKALLDLVPWSCADFLLVAGASVLRVNSAVAACGTTVPLQAVVLTGVVPFCTLRSPKQLLLARAKAKAKAKRCGLSRAVVFALAFCR
jgi:hypothetical protein